MCCIFAHGSYPPAEKQLVLAVDIVQTSPMRACKAGKGHVSVFLQLSSTGFTLVILHIYEDLICQMVK